MPKDQIEILISDCRNLLNAVRDAAGTTRTILDALNARLDALESDVRSNIANATPEKIDTWELRLGALLQAIQQVANDGPTDPTSEMHKAFASNSRIYAIVLWATILTAGMILLLLWWAKKLKNCGMPEEVACALPVVAIMGTIGGFLTCIQSFGRYVGNRQFLRSWTLYYFLFPLKGAGLAIVVFFLIHTDLGKRELDTGASVKATPAETNVVTLAGTVSNVTVGANGQSITNVTANAPVGRIDLVTNVVPPSESKKANLVLACLIAALTGLFANQAIEMLGTVFSVIFKKVEGKDAYRDNTTSGALPGKPIMK